MAKMPSEEQQDEMMARVERAGYEPVRVLSHEVVLAYAKDYEFAFVRVVEDKLYVYLYSHQA